ncbi:MAG: hypothetical protein V9G19_24700 [Tetrasphaera sp.]
MLIDTGPLVAAALTGDRHHRESIDLFTAAVVAVAERLKIVEIATLDRRHFTIVRPSHIAAFALLPD